VSADTETRPMTDEDWEDVEGQAVERLRTPKPVAVPASIVRQAQRSYDENANMEKSFYTEDGEPNPERAAKFAKHMKNAGLHTDPHTSLSVFIDPDNNGSTHVVTWKAGGRRGRAAS
jgi:hypothetical protein